MMCAWCGVYGVWCGCFGHRIMYVISNVLCSSLDYSSTEIWQELSLLLVISFDAIIYLGCFTFLSF